MFGTGSLTRKDRYVLQRFVGFVRRSLLHYWKNVRNVLVAILAYDTNVLPMTACFKFTSTRILSAPVLLGFCPASVTGFFSCCSPLQLSVHASKYTRVVTRLSPGQRRNNIMVVSHAATLLHASLTRAACRSCAHGTSCPRETA